MVSKALYDADRLLAKHTKPTGKYTNLLPVPPAWVDFAPLTRIRSGIGFQPFTPYKYQADLVTNITDNFGTVILKSRQLGISETLINWIIFRCLETPGCTAVFFSMTQGATAAMAKRARLMIESIPKYAQLTTDNLQVLSFSNGSTIHFRNSSINGSRGLESVSIGVFDEAAFIPNIEEIYKAFMPSTSMVGDKARIILNSTPDSESGFYYQKLVSKNTFNIHDALDGIREGEVKHQFSVDGNGWLKALLHWKHHPVYGSNANYLEDTANRFQYSKETIQREYELSFAASEMNVFSAELIRNSFTVELTRKKVDGKTYYATVDPAHLGKDYYTCLVFEEVDSLTQQCQLVDYYRTRGKSMEANIFKTHELLEKYNVSLTLVEDNGMGSTFLETLNRHLRLKFEGIKTTRESKAANIQRVIRVLEEGKLLMPKENKFVDEFLAFSKIGDRLEASTGNHDDLVMATSFFMAIMPYFTTPSMYAPRGWKAYQLRMAQGLPLTPQQEVLRARDNWELPDILPPEVQSMVNHSKK